MNRTKYTTLLVLAGVILLTSCKLDEHKEISLRITNTLPDITLTEVYRANHSINLLEHPLRPGDNFQVTIPRNSSAVKAIDATGGVYNSRLTITDSIETMQIEVSMANRTVFEETIESGGEYWTGSGTCTIRITNSLQDKDVYWLYAIRSGENTEDSPDMLGAFILFPGRTLNTRLEPGCYCITAEDNLRDKYASETISVTRNGSRQSWEISREDTLASHEETGTGTSRFVLCNALDDWIITGVYHKSSSNTNWSGNHLVAHGIEPKEQYSLLLNTGTYDIRVMDEDHDTYTRLAVNIPEEGGSWNITMNDLDLFVP
ncbi:MAG: hypothetical protein K8S62_03150 [Candidatus Sabulitectum sp.]|nr:hypothetical protein [Candidatus Sabulitectum sp.]